MIKALYVHIPFCHSICGYCDFARTKYSIDLSERYLDALEKEIQTIEQDSFVSLYIGGGTPSALSDEQFERLLKMLSRFTVEKEYTVELNPESVNRNKAQLMKQYGVNRVSIGIQSFNEELLRYMHRTHTNKDVEKTFELLDEVQIRNRSIDLIYGFDIQKLSDVMLDLQRAVQMDVTHISIYGLEIYPNTLFGVQKKGRVSDEMDYLMYSSIIDYLNEHAYRQYETSNFALENHQSVHNRFYWKYEDFKGVGLSAASKIGDTRSENTRAFNDYIRGNFICDVQRLSLDDQRFEALMMNLRLNEGIDIREYDRRFDTSILKKYACAIEKNINKGLLEIRNSHLKTTEKGIFVLNDILVDFMD